MSVRAKLNKIEKHLQEEKERNEPRYAFSAIQIENKPWIINKIKNNEVIRRISAESEEGKKLIKEKKTKHPNRPILIMDK